MLVVILLFQHHIRNGALCTAVEMTTICLGEEFLALIAQCKEDQLSGVLTVVFPMSRLKEP